MESAKKTAQRVETTRWGSLCVAERKEVAQQVEMTRWASMGLVLARNKKTPNSWLGVVGGWRDEENHPTSHIDSLRVVVCCGEERSCPTSQNDSLGVVGAGVGE